MIVVISHANDIHGRHMTEILQSRGEDVITLDYSRFPNTYEISFTETGALKIQLEKGHTLDPTSVKSVLNRRQAEPRATRGTDRKVRDYVKRESRNFLDSLPEMLPTFWVSHPDAVREASRKPYHLPEARYLGFTVPKTLFTNSPQDARDFVRELNGSVAIKTLWTPSVAMGRGQHKTGLTLYTRRLSTKQLLAVADNIKHCPIILQEYVEKRFELRITVVGQQVFACEIHSQNSERTKEDWRRYDLENTPHLPHQLPQEIEVRCINLVHHLGLSFGCIDMIVTPKGEYVFLEINPNGQWLWIEELTKLPISEALADLLINKT